MPKLVYTDPESEQEVTIELNDQLPEITIGRNPGNGVRVNNPSISRQHARVIYENGQCTLLDLDSSNGSYINGNRIRSQVLVDGDRIRVGEFPVDYHAQADEATYEVDRDVIDELQREMQVPANGDIRRQTAIGGFGGEPPQQEDDGWGAPGYLGEQEPDQAFDFVDQAADSGPVSLSMDLIEEVDGEEFGVDEDAILEELPIEDLSDPFDSGEPSDARLDTYNAPPDEIAHSLRALDQIAEKPFNHDATVESDVVAAAAALMSNQSPVIGSPSIPAIPADAAPSYDGLDFSDDDDLADAPPPATVMNPDVTADDVDLGEVVRERDELRAILASRAGDAEGASQVQIERLRSERDRLIEERRNSKRQISDLQRKVQDAPSADELESTLAELNAATDRITALEVQIEDLKTELKETIDAVETLESEREMLRAELGDVQQLMAEGASLGEQLSNAEEVASSSKKELQNAIDRVATLQTDLMNSQAEVGQLVGDLEHREARVAELEAAYADASTAVDERDRALEGMNHEVEAARSTIADLEGRVSGLSTELESRPMADDVSKMHAELVASRAAVEALTAERDELVAVRKQLEKDLAEAKQLYETLQKRHGEVGAQLEAASRERDALKHEKGAFARETDYLQVEKRKLDSELRGLRKEVKELTKADKRKKQVFSELSGDLKKLVGENNELQKMIEDLDKQLKQAPDADQLAAAEVRVAELESETTALRKSVSEFEGETAVMTRELGSIGEERDQLRKELEGVQASLETANQTLGALREAASEGESAGAQVVQLEVAVENLNHELEQARAQAAAAQAEAEEAAAAAKKLEADAKSSGGKIEKELEKMKKKLADAENALAEVILEKDRLEDELKSKG